MTDAKVTFTSPSGAKQSCLLSEVEIALDNYGVVSIRSPFGTTRECLLSTAEIDAIRREVKHA